MEYSYVIVPLIVIAIGIVLSLLSQAGMHGLFRFWDRRDRR